MIHRLSLFQLARSTISRASLHQECLISEVPTLPQIPKQPFLDKRYSTKPTTASPRTPRRTLYTKAPVPQPQPQSQQRNASGWNFELGDGCLTIQFAAGHTARFHYVWLRDNCRCKACYHPYTRQRLLSTYDIPLDIRPSEVVQQENMISIRWPDNHMTFIPISFLERHSPIPPLGDSTQKKNTKVLWNESIASSMPRVNYDDLFQSERGGQLAAEEAVLDWLIKIDHFGFCLVDGVPPNTESTEKLLRKIAFIRETHYGSFWDFTANMEHGDTAYTNLPLGAHTDTTYFSDPAGLQLFHLLSPPTSHSGGKSLLVDGFSAAAQLRMKHPEAYQTLSTLPVETHASGGEGVAFRPLIPQPVLAHDPRTGHLTIVRWNPDDRRPIRGHPDSIKQWYDAAREWENIIKSQEMELWMQMKVGQALIFDNHRVLHGRSSFTGSRRLCGGYINGDDYRSRLKSLKHQFQPGGAQGTVWEDID